jgi:hypothetical protein
LNKSILVALLVSLLSTVILVLTYSYGQSDFVGILINSMLLSTPLYISFLLLVTFCRTHFRENHVLLNKLGISVFSCTAILHLSWNSFMLFDVWQKGSLGPAQGYSGLILLFGSFKAIFWGCVVGILIHYISVVYKNAANKSLKQDK